MPNDAAKLLSELLALPEKDRAFIAAGLLQSLRGVEVEGAEEAWDAEIARRVEEVKSGKIKLIPWAEARRRMMGEGEARAD